MLLSYNRLCELGPSLFAPFVVDHVNASSIDVTLGGTILVEAPHCGVVDYGDRTGHVLERIELTEEGYVIRPGEFILAQTVEVFNLPDTISGEYKLKSSMARCGLEHLKAGWCDAGWHGSVLTLELKNMNLHHGIRIRPGQRIGQIVFFEHEPVPAEGLYANRGRYNGDREVSAAKR